MTQECDFIVVGAGSAGAVLANRLSASGDYQVLLLEAGPADKNRWIHIPAGVSRTMTDPEVNWMYFSEPEPELKGRRVYHPRGKVLGGTSAINGMAYIRGHPWDYNQWAQAGNRGWSWDEVLPLFKRGERNNTFTNDSHGTEGEMGVSHGTTRHPSSEIFFQGARAVGISEIDDFNDGRQEGFGWLQYTIENGTRTTSAVFLRDAAGRANLDIQTEALVQKIEIEEGRAKAVVYDQGGNIIRAEARRGIIVSGGAFNSPQILNLSGIGDADELAAHGIETVHHLPGVGKNLQDHMYVNHVSKVDPVHSINHEVQGIRLIPQVLRYLTSKKGHLSMAVSNACMFTTVMPHSDAPDVQVMFRPVSIDYSGATPAIHKFPGVSASLTQLRPESRGTVSLASANPKDAPKIFFNYLSNEADYATLTAGFRKVLDIFETPAMQQMVKGMVAPDKLPMTDADIRSYIQDTAQTVYHPVGTCKMGSDPMAVVDERLRVHGIEGLRVADASIMPTICSGNTNAPSIMIGEKCADMLLEDNA